VEAKHRQFTGKEIILEYKKTWDTQDSI